MRVGWSVGCVVEGTSCECCDRPVEGIEVSKRDGAGKEELLHEINWWDAMAGLDRDSSEWLSEAE